MDVNKHHKFFLTKFHVRNFDARRIFYEKLICGSSEKCQKVGPSISEKNHDLEVDSE